MGQFLKHILDGARQVLVICPPSEYIRPSRKGFNRDHITLNGDSQQVVRDFNKVIISNGKVNNRKR
jgi:hypothetical protein